MPWQSVRQFMGDVRAPTGHGTNLLIDATGEKIAQIGAVWNKDRASKSITRLQFRSGSITSAGGSVLTLSLQNVSLTAGPPLQPDEVQDQTVAVPLSALSAGGWYRTNALSANRSVAFGEMLAVVWEYDGAGRLGSDSAIINFLTEQAGAISGGNFGCSLKTGGSWAIVTTASPNVLLEFDDGTFGRLGFTPPVKTFTTVTVNSIGSPQEYAMRFKVPIRCKIEGAHLFMRALGVTTDFQVTLNRDTTELAAVTIDSTALQTNSAVRPLLVYFSSEIELEPGNTYYLTLKPSTAQVTFTHVELDSNSHFDAWDAFGTAREWYMATRDTGGSWTDVNTSRPYFYPLMTAIDDGVAARAGFNGTPHGVVT